MPSALSADLRERVATAIEAGASRREAARRFEVSPAIVVRWHETFVRGGGHGQADGRRSAFTRRRDAGPT